MEKFFGPAVIGILIFVALSGAGYLWMLWRAWKSGFRDRDEPHQ
jgi:hypothetical protein